MIELALVIRELREELERAVVAGAGEALRFELGPVELEVAVAVERSAEAGGKVRFWVVEFGGHGEVERTGTQRVRLALTPRLAQGNATVYVAGQAEFGEE